MKQVVLLLLIVLSTLSNAQTLKGFTIGEKSFSSSKMTTVSGFEGLVSPIKTKNNTVAAIVFNPSSGWSTANHTKYYIKHLDSEEIRKFRANIQSNYGILLEPKTTSYDGDNKLRYCKYQYIKNGIVYSLITDKEDNSYDLWEVSFAIFSLHWMNVRKEEIEYEKKTDF